MRYSLVAALLLLSTVAVAQTTRVVRPAQFWPEAQGELALGNGDYLLLALHGERLLSTAPYSTPLGLDLRRVLVGYEHFLSTRWSLGATLRFEDYGSGRELAPEVLLRHRAPLLAGITFGQRLGLEYRKQFYDYYGPVSPDGETWGRLRLDLEKLLPLGTDPAGVALRPRLSYEAATHLRLQKADNDPLERTIQFTSLRAEVGVRLSPRVDITPWFAYQTDYYKSLPQYSPVGNPVSGGDANYVRPTVGLDLRFTLLGSTQAEAQPLPTQH